MTFLRASVTVMPHVFELHAELFGQGSGHFGIEAFILAGFLVEIAHGLVVARGAYEQLAAGLDFRKASGLRVLCGHAGDGGKKQ